MIFRYATIALFTILSSSAGAQVGADVQWQVRRELGIDGIGPGMTMQSRPNLLDSAPSLMPPGISGPGGPSMGQDRTASCMPGALGCRVSMPCDQPGPVLPEGVYAVRNGEERSLFVAVIDGGKQEGLTLQPGELVIRVIAGGSPSAVGLLVGEDQYVQTVESRRTYCIDTRLAQQGKVFTID